MTKKFIEFTVGIVIISGFFWYIYSHIDIFSSVIDISIYNIGIISIAILMTWVFNSFQAYYLLRTQGVRIGFWEIFLLSTACILADYFPIRSGAFLRMHYLKSIHGLRYTRFASVTSMRTIILIFVTGILGLIGIIGIFSINGAFSFSLTSIFFLMIIFTLISYFKKLPKFESPTSKFVKIWNDFSEGFSIARECPKTTTIVLLMIILQLLCVGVRIYFSFAVLNVKPSIFLILLLSPLSVLILLLSITPGGIGLREGIMGYITLISGYDFSSGVFAGTVDRAIMLIITLLIGSLSFLYIWVQLKKESV